jgi:hypothetical protein
MPTLRQAMERRRDPGTSPPGGITSVRSLHNRFPSVPSNSTRALIASMFASQKLPWAIILCRFKNAPPNPAVEAPVEKFYRTLFTPGTGGLVEYWRDASLGALDVNGSRIFGWVEVEIPRSQAGGSSITNPTGPGRSGLVDFAIRAVQRAGGDPFSGFHSQIAVYTENWSKDGVTQKGDFSEWGPFWIDGSADGRGKVTLTPPHAGDITAHEMGHGFGMQHDFSADFKTDYGDPCCIMSQTPLFFNPVFNANFGPRVCFAHLVQRDWMYHHRILRDDGAWTKNLKGAIFILAPTTDTGASANLGLALAYEQDGNSWDYLLEYARPTNWDQGLNGDFLFVRRIASTDKIAPTPTILGSLLVPEQFGIKKKFVEPIGNVEFQVERFDPAGRTVKVTARKL